MPLVTGKQTLLPQKRRRGIDDRVAFMAWIEFGNLRRAAKYLEDQGLVENLHGKPYSQSGIGLAAKRFVLRHPEEAKPFVLRAWEEEGITIPEDDWNVFLIRTAMQVFGKNSKALFLNWIEDMDFERYDYVYGKRFGIVPTHSEEIS